MPLDTSHDELNIYPDDIFISGRISVRVHALWSVVPLQERFKASVIPNWPFLGAAGRQQFFL